jgi:hypothetical protein
MGFQWMVALVGAGSLSLWGLGIMAKFKQGEVRNVQ